MVKGGCAQTCGWQANRDLNDCLVTETATQILTLFTMWPSCLNSIFAVDKKPTGEKKKKALLLYHPSWLAMFSLDPDLGRLSQGIFLWYIVVVVTLDKALLVLEHHGSLVHPWQPHHRANQGLTIFNQSNNHPLYCVTLLINRRFFFVCYHIHDVKHLYSCPCTLKSLFHWL